MEFIWRPKQFGAGLLGYAGFIKVRQEHELSGIKVLRQVFQFDIILPPSPPNPLAGRGKNALSAFAAPKASATATCRTP